MYGFRRGFDGLYGQLPRRTCLTRALLCPSRAVLGIWNPQFIAVLVGFADRPNDVDDLSVLGNRLRAWARTNVRLICIVSTFLRDASGNWNVEWASEME